MKLLKGINRDVDPIDQPEGTYRDALNLIPNKRLGALASEEGNQLSDTIEGTLSGDDFTILGHTFIYDGIVILFMVDEANGDSVIGKFDTENDSYQELLSDPDLKFDEASAAGNVIDATSAINNKGQAVVYWTDDYNPPRFLNVDDIPSYSSVKELDIFAKITSPTNISLDQVRQYGGSLESGSYYFALAYIDEDDTITNFVSVTSAINVIDDFYGNTDENVDGAQSGTPTSRSIDLEFQNLDTNYNRMLVVAIPKIGNVFQTPKILPEIRFSDTSYSFTYTGQETFEEGSLDEVIIDKVSYLTAKTIEQLDGVLYMGNLTEDQDIGYQRYANNIKAELTTKPFDLTGSNETHKDETFVYLNKSFQRDEVYAFYISFVLNDGSETFAYHIPGREANSGDKDPITEEEIQDIDEQAEKFQFQNTIDGGNSNLQYWENKNESYPDTEDFDVYGVDSNGDPVDPGGGALGDTTLRGEPVRHHHFPKHQDYPMYDFDRDRNGQLLGIKFTDVKIPSSMIDQIEAVKFYYAKRTDNNKRVIDQSALTNIKTEAHEGEDTYQNEIAPDDGSTTIEGEFVVGARPFRSMRTKANIGALTHINTVSRLRGIDADNGISNTTTNLFNRTRQTEYAIAQDSRFRRITSRAFIPSNEDIVDVESKGFDQNASTFQEESKMLLEFSETLDVGRDADEVGVNEWKYLVSLHSHKTDVYNSFDQQQLVWTGIIETNLAKFDPTEDYEVGSDGKASGELEVTSGSGNADPGSTGSGSLTVDSNNLDPSTTASPASATINIAGEPTSVGAGNNYHIEFDFLDDQDNVVSSLVSATLTKGTSTIDDIVNAIRDMFNGDGTVSSDWTASADTGTDTVTVTSDTNGTQWNDYDISSITVVDEGDGNSTALYGNSSHTFPTSGGQVDSAAETADYQLNVGGDLGGTVTLNGDQSTSDIASAIAGATAPSGFTLSANGSNVDVTTDSNTDSENGDTITLNLVSGQDDVGVTDGSISGGDDPNSVVIGLLFEAPVFNNGNYYVEYTFSENQTAQQIADALTTDLQNDTTVTDQYTITQDGTTIEFLANDFGGDYNGTISFISIDGSSTILLEDGVGASDSDYDSGQGTTRYSSVYNLNQEGFDLGSQIEVTLDIDWSDDTSAASGFVEESPNGTDSWSVVVSTGNQGEATAGSYNQVTNETFNEPYIRIGFSIVAGQDIETVSGSVAADLEQTKSSDKESAGITINDADLSGGSLSEVNPSEFESEDIFNGDTFINFYGERSTNGANKQLLYYPCESMDNVGYRHQGSEYGEIYYPKSSDDEVLQLEENDNTPDDQRWYDNPYLYNEDYSAQGDVKASFPFPKYYDPVVNRPTRVIRSQESANNTSSFQNFRTFLANDHIDLPRNRGELVKLSASNGNVLLPHMERGIFRTKGREELVTGDVRAFIGSGDIFSVKPDEIQFTEEGYGGLQDPQTAITTPYGYFFVDREANKVFLLGQQLDPVSENGLRNFFERELSNFDPANDTLQTAWDDKWDRVILAYIDGNDNTNSWTLSYFPRMEMWASFHSYKPSYMFSALTTFYSLDGADIYEHNIASKSAEFYGNNEQTIIEFVDNRQPRTTKIFFNIQYTAEVEDSNGEKLWKETFDQFRMYNDRQDTDVQDIVYFTGVNGNARNVEGTWKINKFRDLVDQQTGNIDPSKPWYEQSKMVGKYAVVRLIFDNDSQKSIYLYDAFTGVKESVR